MSAERGITVIVPCFNGAHFVGAAIESALSQTAESLKVLVVDDGSTDCSLDVIKSYGDRITWRSFKNGGASAARNRGLQDVKTSHCVFLDADDSFEDGFISTQAAAASQGDYDLVFGESKMVWPDGHAIEKQAVPGGVTIDHALSMVLSAGWMPPNAILWRTEFIRKIGGWSEELRRNEDGELIARALLSGPIFTSSSGSRAIYRQHHGPDRISARRDSSALRSNLFIGQWVFDRIGRDPMFPLARCALGRSMSELAREAYDWEHDDVGRDAERLARSLGCYSQSGTLPHRIASRLLGLRLKCRLARRIKRLG